MIQRSNETQRTHKSQRVTAAVHVHVQYHNTHRQTSLSTMQFYQSKIIALLALLSLAAALPCTLLECYSSRFFPYYNPLNTGKALNDKVAEGDVDNGSIDK